MSFWRELGERRVGRTAILYLAAAWLVLQVADLLFAAWEFPAEAMRLLVGILSVGFPIALGLSWWLDVAPAEPGASESSPRSARPAGGRFLAALVVLVGLGGGAYLLGRYEPAGMADSPEHPAGRTAPADSIAVMPFVNVSAAQGYDYFSDGLASELMNLLVDVAGLRVIARSATFSYKGKDVDPRRIGKDLNVATLLEGEVRRDGDRLRISVQLVDAETGYRIWHHSYDRHLADVFAIQNDIAEAVVRNLVDSLPARFPRARPADPEAFDAYLDASYHYLQRTPEGYNKAIELLTRSLEIEPDFTPAWTTLASAYINQVFSGQLAKEESYELARPAVERALAIDPDYAFANSARGWIAMYFERDYPTAAAFFERALELAPGSATVLGNAAVFAIAIGATERGIQLSREAIARDPVSAVLYSNLADQYVRAGRYGDAEQAAARALELSPGLSSAIVVQCESLLLSERPGLALEQAVLIPRPDHRLYIEALANIALGRESDAERALGALIDDYASEDAVLVAQVLAYRGDVDSAIAWLTRAVSEGQDTFGLRSSWPLRSLHEDARWHALLKRLGLADEQVAQLAI